MSHGVSPEVLQAALVAAESAPDLRRRRVTRAKTHMQAGMPDAATVAKAMIARIRAESGR